MKDITNNIKKYLDKNNMTQRELAAAINTTEVSISRYVNGKRYPTAPTIILIAKALGCCAEDLYSLEENDKCALIAESRNEVDVFNTCIEIMGTYSMNEILSIISFLASNVKEYGDVFPVDIK